MLDYSMSIGKDNWGYVREMTRRLTDVIHAASELGKTSRLGMFRFGAEVRQLLDLAENANYNDVDGVIQRLLQLSLAGSTPMFDVTSQAAAMFDRNVRQIGDGYIASRTLILFTDGRPDQGTDKTFNVLKSLMDKGIHVVMIGKQNSEYTVKVHNSTFDPHSLHAPASFTC